MSFSSSKEGREEEKTGYSALCLPGAGDPLIPLSPGLTVRHSLAPGLSIFAGKMLHDTFIQAAGWSDPS